MVPCYALGLLCILYMGCHLSLWFMLVQKPWGEPLKSASKILLKISFWDDMTPSGFNFEVMVYVNFMS